MAYNAKEYWDLTPGAGTTTGTVTIYWDGYKDGAITSVSDLRVAHKTGGGWQNEGAASASGTTTAGTVTSSSISTWSPFALGSISLASPLPLKLLSFTGTTTAQTNVLNWRTAFEEPGTTFGLERSNDGQQYSLVASLPGKGEESQYSVQDPAGTATNTLYRLRIMEPSGLSYSNTVLFRQNAQQTSWQVQPNPFSNELQWSGADVTGDVAIVNALGQEVLRFPAAGSRSINTAGWIPGVYILRMPDGTISRLIRQ